MKKLRFFFSFFLFCLFLGLYAQNHTLSSVLQSCRYEMAKGNSLKAVKEGAQAVQMYADSRRFQEAFELCNDLDAFIRRTEKLQERTMYDLRFYVVKERLAMYITINNKIKAAQQFAVMNQLATSANNSQLQAEWLDAQAGYYFAIGQPQKAIACYNVLIDKYKKKDDLSNIAMLYKKISELSVRNNQAAPAVNAYKEYVKTQEALKIKNAKTEFTKLQKKYGNTLQELEATQNDASFQKGKFITMVVISIVLAIALVLAILLILRLLVMIRQQKRSIKMANENNQQKTSFLENIVDHVMPTLSLLDSSSAPIRALNTFFTHVQDFSNIEKKSPDINPAKEFNVSKFCFGLAETIKPCIPSDVTFKSDALNMNITANTEVLEHVLLHLLHNAIHFVEAGGKITLAYKKRGARSHEFSVTNSGTPIPREKQELIFKPFSEKRDLIEGDGLGLPICALMITKINGTLSLDQSYSRGARFVIELHT